MALSNVQSHACIADTPTTLCGRASHPFGQAVASFPPIGPQYVTASQNTPRRQLPSNTAAQERDGITAISGNVTPFSTETMASHPATPCSSHLYAFWDGIAQPAYSQYTALFRDRLSHITLPPTYTSHKLAREPYIVFLMRTTRPNRLNVPYLINLKTECERSSTSFQFPTP